MRRGLDALLFSNLFIAVCAALAVEQTYVQLGFGWQWNWLTLCVGMATFAQYNFQRLFTLRVIKRETLTPTTIWLARRWMTMMVLSIGAVCLAIYSFIQLQSDLWLPLIIIAGIAGLYAVPIGNFRLREVGMLKLFLIAVIWGLVTVTLPAFQLGIDVWSNQHGLLLAERILFILALTLPFDARDIFIDAAYDLKTIPSLIGRRATVVLCLGLLIGMVVLEGVRQMMVTEQGFIFFGLIASAVLSSWVILNQNRWEGRYYYLGLLDGMILLQASITMFLSR